MPKRTQPLDATELVVVRTTNLRQVPLSPELVTQILAGVERQLRVGLAAVGTVNTTSATRDDTNDADQDPVPPGCVLLYTTTEWIVNANGTSQLVTCRVYQCEDGRLIKRYGL